MTVFVAVHKVLSLCHLISSYCQWLRKSYIVKNICSLVVKPSTKRLHKMPQIPPMTFWSKISVFFMSMFLETWPFILDQVCLQAEVHVKRCYHGTDRVTCSTKSFPPHTNLAFLLKRWLQPVTFHLWMLKPTPKTDLARTQVSFLGQQQHRCPPHAPMVA